MIIRKVQAIVEISSGGTSDSGSFGSGSSLRPIEVDALLTVDFEKSLISGKAS
jgi:hypothetical protein